MPSIPLISIPHDATAIFRNRPNRFIGIVDIFAPENIPGEHVHVHDPGRLLDLLYPGNRVLLRKASSPTRKTQWDLIAAEHDGAFVLTHSGFHRAISEQLLTHPDIQPLGELASLAAEIKYGHSRLDFRGIRTDGSIVWIEVKGCTMAENGIAMFPDAPTKRGAKHINTLLTLREHELDAVILFLIFRTEATVFAPHAGIDPIFANLFQEAVESGVMALPMVCSFVNNCISYEKIIPIVSYPI